VLKATPTITPPARVHAILSFPILHHEKLMNLKIFAALLFCCLVLPLAAQKEPDMTQHATGPFEVKVTPIDPAFKFDENPIGRMSLDKHFHGDLEAASQGEMLSGGNPAKGSAGYVAMERVSGTLNGHTGTFLLMHNATMDNGAYHLNVIVVPSSGTGQLTGLSGSMQIIIKDGLHSYDFSYTLPAK
jgi:Protein of unknown function (DUF3224)